MALDRNAQARMQFNQKTRAGAREEGGLLESGEPTDQPGEKLTPQEEQTVKQAVEVAGQMLYSDKVSKGVAQMIQQPPHVEAIGDTAAQIVKSVDDRMNLPEDLIIPVGLLVTEMVSDLGEELGFYKESKQFVSKCVKFTIKKLYEIYGVDQEGVAEQAGEFSAEELQSAVGQQTDDGEVEIADEEAPAEEAPAEEVPADEMEAEPVAPEETE